MFVKLSILAILAIVQNVNTHHCGMPTGPCTCAQIANPFCSGEDVSDNRPLGPLVVRPQPLPKPLLSPTSSLGLSSGGPCTIKKAIVKPAIVPRPVYRPAVNKQGICDAASALASAASALCHQSQQVQTFAATSGASSAAGQYLGEPLIINSLLPGQAIQQNCAPADAVSLAIAYKQAMEHQKVLSEDRLAFGFRKLPIELPKIRRQPKPEVCEENLFSLNGQIVELKPVAAPCNSKSLAEEAEEVLLDLSEEETNAEAGNGIRKVSLGELGYGPIKDTSKTFINVPVANPVELAVDAVSDGISSLLSGSGSCQDGFQEGSVVYKTLPKVEPIVGTPVDFTCDASDEAEKPLPIVPCNCIGNTAGIAAQSGNGVLSTIGNIFQQSSSSSSCKKSSCNHRVFLDKLC